jgi:hypothetical protein
MNGLNVSISWEWTIGIFVTVASSLIAISWYASSRFTGIEKDIDWIKKDIDWIKQGIRDLKVSSDNRNTENPAFQSQSPVNLTETGDRWLNESGLKSYIDSHKVALQKNAP